MRKQAISLAFERTQAFDQAGADAFAGQIMDTVSSGAVAVMISIGHRTGLFDTLSDMPPSTSAEVAQAAELNERYVREWLAVMVTGRIVTYDPSRQTYELPAEHAACLARDAALGNLAVFGQHIAIMGQVQDDIIEHFEDGAGTTYGDYPHFHHIMAEDSGQTVTPQLFGTILPLAEGVLDRLEAGINVLDAGCGRGGALIAMAERFPRSRFVGYDFEEETIAFANDAIAAAGLTNIRFETRDLSGYDEKDRFDFITTFDAVHDQRDPESFVARLFAALRPGGAYLMQDIGGSAHLENNLDFPMAPLLYAVSCTHCMAVSLGQGGAGLGTMWGWETAEAFLRKAGFTEIRRNVLPHDPMNVWFVSHKL
jgi:2-polyprenyl-3-methyl-5-hydroxy-6-metoxy-1,4-benzoquinol methylase